MRFERSHLQFVGFVVGGAAIVGSTAAQPDQQLSMQQLLEPHIMAWAALSVVAALLLAWWTRLVFVLTRAWLTVRGLTTAERMPVRLAASIARTGASSARCISSGLPIAFCAGILRPSIIVSEGLAEELDDRELDAV